MLKVTSFWQTVVKVGLGGVGTAKHGEHGAQVYNGVCEQSGVQEVRGKAILKLKASCITVIFTFFGLAV